MEFLAEYGSFLLKVVTLVVAVLILVGGIVSIAARNKKSSDGELVIKKVNEELEDNKDQLEYAVSSEGELKALEKQRKKEDKEKEKKEKKLAKTAPDPAVARKKRVYVIDFDGDIRASDVELMRKEITAILTLAEKNDEVVVRLESGGGMVHSYGFGASQLKRIRDRGIHLTVCVDMVAASGGYMMACLADRIVAAPFAIIGSIGVVAQLPNFSKVLKKYDVDYELFTAGEYKRTVTMFGENTDKAKEKFQADLEETHDLFKHHVKHHRPRVDIEAVATGDIWYGVQAIDHKLIDEVGTSDDYLVAACDNADVYTVRYEFKKTLQEKLGFAVQVGFERAVTRVLTSLQNQMQSKG